MALGLGSLLLGLSLLLWLLLYMCLRAEVGVPPCAALSPLRWGHEGCFCELRLILVGRGKWRNRIESPAGFSAHKSSGPGQAPAMGTESQRLALGRASTLPCRPVLQSWGGCLALVSLLHSPSPNPLHRSLHSCLA